MSKRNAERYKTPAIQEQMDRIAASVGAQGVKVAEADRKRRIALGETMEVWIDRMGEDARIDLFATLELLATRTNRRRIATHRLRDDEVGERVEEALAKAAALEAAPADDR